MMECQKCGYENNPNSKFCEQCGTPLQQIADAQKPPKKAWYKRWWIWLLIALGTFMLFINSLCVCGMASSNGRKGTPDSAQNQTAENTTDAPAELSAEEIIEQVVGAGYEEVPASILYNHYDDYDGKKVVTAVKITNTATNTLYSEMDSDKLTASISFSFDKNSDMNHASTGDYAIIFGVADGKSILGEYRDTRHCFVAAVGEQAEIEYDKLTRKAIDIEKDKQAQAEEKSKNEKETYINSCETIDYETLARNPEKYKGQHFKLKGKVVQVLDSDSWFENATTLRVNITNKGDDNFELWDDTIVCSVNIPKGGDRILEDDIIEFYGDCDGLYTYKSIFGQKISVPKIDIKYYGIAK